MNLYKLFCSGYINKNFSLIEVLDNLCGKNCYEVFQLQLINNSYYEITFNYYCKGSTVESVKYNYFKRLEFFGYNDWLLKDINLVKNS